MLCLHVSCAAPSCNCSSFLRSCCCSLDPDERLLLLLLPLPMYGYPMPALCSLACLQPVLSFASLLNGVEREAGRDEVCVRGWN